MIHYFPLHIFHIFVVNINIAFISFHSTLFQFLYNKNIVKEFDFITGNFFSLSQHTHKFCRIFFCLRVCRIFLSKLPDYFVSTAGYFFSKSAGFFSPNLPDFFSPNLPDFFCLNCRIFLLQICRIFFLKVCRNFLSQLPEFFVSKSTGSLPDFLSQSIPAESGSLPDFKAQLLVNKKVVSL